VTLSIAASLSVLPDGRVAENVLNPIEVGEYLRKHYGTAEEVARRERHARRNILYSDGGCEYMCAVIDEVFQDEDVRKLRKAWVRHARFSNSLKRIVNEGSTVYAEPASRTVGGGTANQAAYDELMESALIDEVMDYANRMLNLHRAIVIGPRIRVDGADTAAAAAPRSLVYDVVTPDNAFAVTDPNDTTRVIAWGIRVAYRSARAAWQSEPVWCLWNDHESWLLDKNLDPIGDPRPHALGVNPWIGVTYHAQAIPGFWPGEEGEDLVAAQVAIWMANVLLLKETKSATKVGVSAGDVSNAANGQAADTERWVQAPEGVQLSTLDMSMDTKTFTDAGNYALEKVGANHGLAMGVLTHQGTQSAEAGELLRQPLRELRRKQIKTLRRVERSLAALTAVVVANDAPALAFKVEAFSCNFGEPQSLASEEQRLANFEKKKALGLTNVLEYYCQFIDPDATPEDALKAIMRNIAVEDVRIALMRHQMAMSGEMGARAAAADRGVANGTRDQFGPATAVPQGEVVTTGHSAPNSAEERHAA
jgi:hypothetical protein